MLHFHPTTKMLFIDDFRNRSGKRFKVKHDKKFSGTIGFSVHQNKQQNILTLKQQLSKTHSNASETLFPHLSIVQTDWEKHVPQTAADCPMIRKTHFEHLLDHFCTIYIATQTQPDILFCNTVFHNSANTQNHAVGEPQIVSCAIWQGPNKSDKFFIAQKCRRISSHCFHEQMISEDKNKTTDEI